MCNGDIRASKLLIDAAGRQPGTRDVANVAMAVKLINSLLKEND
jgi:hypothetical protein